MGKELSKQEFVKKAIKELGDPPEKGIHTRYSGFQEAFQEYFGEDPLEATEKLEKREEIVKVPEKDGSRLYLPEDAPGKGNPQETINQIISGHANEEPSEDKQPSNEQDNSDSEKTNHAWIPLVVDEEGAHETTEYALTSGPNRVWLKEFTDNGRKIRLKSIYISKEDVKKMDRVRTEWSWDKNSESWEINADSLAYVIDHFVNLDYDIAISPSLSHLIVEGLPLEVEYLLDDKEEGESKNDDFKSDKENEPGEKEEDIEYKVKEPTSKGLDNKQFISKTRGYLKELQAKLTPIHVVEIWEKLESGEKADSVAEDYPVSASTINEIRKKANWAWLTNTIQNGNDEKYKGILVTLYFLILFEEQDEGFEEALIQKSLKRVNLYDTKLSPLDIIDIWERLKLGENPDYIAQDYSVRQETINGIKNGSNWDWLTKELTPQNVKMYKRLLKDRMIEDDAISKEDFVRYTTLEKTFVRKAWRKVRQYDIDLSSKNVIDIWKELQKDNPVSGIAKKYDLTEGQVKNIRNKKSYAWLIRKLEEGNTEKYKGMLIALESYKSVSAGAEKSEGKEEVDKKEESERKTRRNERGSKEVFKSVKSRYILDDLDSELEGTETKNKAETNETGAESNNSDINPGDVVEHSLGMRGKVQKIDGKTLLVKVGPNDARKWKENVCTFVRKGK